MLTSKARTSSHTSLAPTLPFITKFRLGPSSHTGGSSRLSLFTTTYLYSTQAWAGRSLRSTGTGLRQRPPGPMHSGRARKGSHIPSWRTLPHTATSPQGFG
jgi:hypothetical protein